MGRVVLITGGSRSGKSRRALEVGAGRPAPRLFVATCTALDGEMAARIERHRASRQGGGWQTVEEPLDLEGAVGREPAGVVLVDCLTLWVSNLLLQAQAEGRILEEEEIESRARDLLRACRLQPGAVVLVTNEVGLGIVPDNALARRFRDLAGRCNQTAAAAADEVTLMVSGLPLTVKTSP
ncbi:MAG: bifunctional adenosylcobinamide kinase/adenosylcobinamide-phosphate guanylyltransferase [Candidatus Latescibacterota bacterium]